MEGGVMLAAGDGFFLDPADGAHNVRLAFSFAGPAGIEKAIGILGHIVQELEAA